MEIPEGNTRRQQIYIGAPAIRTDTKADLYAFVVEEKLALQYANLSGGGFHAGGVSTAILGA